jgi:hypothetical protein
MHEGFHLESEKMTLLVFLGAEVRELRLNTPGESGLLGGYQLFENWLLAHIDTHTGRCLLTPEKLERMIRYCEQYRGGGPNDRIRRACIPALLRAGVAVKKNQWNAFAFPS